MGTGNVLAQTVGPRPVEAVEALARSARAKARRLDRLGDGISQRLYHYLQCPPYLFHLALMQDQATQGQPQVH